MIEAIAVIPARGGSKRIPGKNVKLFQGKPMIEYAIAVARRCNLFSQIIVSSDDDTILREADRLQVSTLRRPAELADDHIPTLPVIAHAIQAREGAARQTDLAVCCIYPCVPFLERGDLERGLETLIGNPTRFVFPVVEFPSPPDRALVMSATGALSPLSARNVTTRTQDFPTAYYDGGQFYWAMTQTWLSRGAIHSNAHGMVLPAWRAVDIDTPEDWHRAELLYRAIHDVRP